MVRKTTAQVKSTRSKPQNTSKKPEGFNFDSFNVEELVKKFLDWFGENWMTYVGFILVILWVIQLRQFIVGIAFLTVGILLIAWFFGTNNKK